MSESYKLDNVFGHIEMKSEFIRTGPSPYEGYFLNTIIHYGYKGKLISRSVERGLTLVAS